MLINFFYYCFFSSDVFVYGLGMHKALMKSRKPMNVLAEFVKFLITVSVSSLLVYLVTVQLIKINFGEIGPFIAIIIITLINVFLELVVKISHRTSMIDMAIELMCVVIGVTEAVSIWDGQLNSIFCMLSYFVCIPFFYSLRKRIEMNAPTKNARNLSLLFLSLAVVALILMSWNVSWLNSGRL